MRRVYTVFDRTEVIALDVWPGDEVHVWDKSTCTWHDTLVMNGEGHLVESEPKTVRLPKAG